MNFKDIKEELYEILDKEYNIYREILEIFKEERAAIMVDDVSTLNALIIKGEEKIHRIKYLEEKRRSLLEGDSSITRLDVFINQITDPEDRERFWDLKDRLLSIMEELKYIKEANELIIKKTLKYLRFYIELLSKEMGSPVYGKAGVLNVNRDFMNKLDERV